MEENGIKHCRTTTLWPQENSEVENFMKPLTKAARSAHVDRKVWKKHLHKFLLNYRTTPHCTTGYTPAQLLFNRKVQNKLPQLADSKQINSQEVKRKDEAKAKIKVHVDIRFKAKLSSINVGDLVLVRQRKENKLSTHFNPSPFRVTSKKEQR